MKKISCYSNQPIKIVIEFLAATTSEAPSPTTITTDESTKSPNPSTTMNSSPMTTQAPFDGRTLSKIIKSIYTVSDIDNDHLTQFTEVTVYEPDDTTTIQDMAESKDESMDNTLTDLLNETNLDDLEQLVEEYLPEPEPLEYNDYDVKENLVDYSGDSQ